MNIIKEKSHISLWIIVVLFIGTAIIPGNFSYLVPGEYYRFYFLSFLSSIFLLFIILNKQINSSYYILSFLFIILFLLIVMKLHGAPWLSFIKCISYSCLLISLYQIKEDDRVIIFSLFPILSSFTCFIVILGKYGKISYLSFENSAWFDNVAEPMLLISIGFSSLLPKIHKKKEKIKQLIVTFILLIHIVVSIIVEARTTLLSMIVISVVFIYLEKNSISNKYKIILIAAIIVLTAILYLLLLKKNDSSDGRLLIWRITVLSSTDHLLLGHGPGSFISQYMSNQAMFLKDCVNSHHTNIAGNIYHPFNEFILVFYQYGLVGLTILFTLLFSTIRLLRNNTKYLLCFIALIVYSCFSYPSRYVIFWIVLLFIISDPNLSHKRSMIFELNRKRRLLLLCIPFSLVMMTSADIAFNYYWKNYYNKFQDNKTDVVKNYAKLAKYWNYDPRFLYNWAMINYQSSNYSSCIQILNKCSIWLDDYYVELLYGECYELMEQYDDALKHFTICKNMWPSLLIPEYKIFEIYKLKGDTNKAIIVGEHIVDRIPKVANVTTKTIKASVSDYLETLK